jgi:hypothetical protein
MFALALAASIRAVRDSEIPGGGFPEMLLEFVAIERAVPLAPQRHPEQLTRTGGEPWPLEIDPQTVAEPHTAPLGGLPRRSVVDPL